MSTEPAKPVRRTTVPQIRARKGGEPIVCLTSYHAHTAAIVDRHADLILVGDSLGMVMHGMETTVGVPLDLMVIERDSFCAVHERRITHEDDYYQAISAGWSDALKEAFTGLADYSFYSGEDDRG